MGGEGSGRKPTFKTQLVMFGLDVQVAVTNILDDIKNHNATFDEVEEGQDVEVVVDFQPNKELNLELFYQELSKMGTSIQVGEGDGMYRMHIHVPTDNLYLPIDYTRTLGVVTKVAIENLIAQMEDVEKNSEENLTLSEVNAGQIAVISSGGKD